MLARPLVLFSIVILLSGCAATPPQRESAPLPPRVTTEGSQCGARYVQDHLESRYDEALGDSIREESGAEALRVLRPGEAHTMEYRAERLNIRLDEESIITTIGCG
jgi:hypothetical protein